MAIVTYEKTDLRERKYPGHYYRIERYERTAKINLWVHNESNGNTSLKMSLQETKDLITRLQFAVYEAENSR